MHGWEKRLALALLMAALALLINAWLVTTGTFIDGDRPQPASQIPPAGNSLDGLRHS